MPAPPPRLFCIPATAAPVVAVLRRGPTDWCHVGRWDLSALRYEPGAWIRATLYPQKCDLSPDGRWLLYSALDHRSDWEAGSIYEAVSRLPWLHALAAWEAGTTYTRGAHFVAEPGRNGLGVPDVGDAAPLLRRYGSEVTSAPPVRAGIEPPDPASRRRGSTIRRSWRGFLPRRALSFGEGRSRSERVEFTHPAREARWAEDDGADPVRCAARVRARVRCASPWR